MTTAKQDSALISIIVPCRNEREFVEQSISSLLNQEASADRIEVLVADGDSDDGTRQVLDQMARLDPRLSVLDNPDRRTPEALKRLLASSSGSFIVRADSHSIYPPNYVETLVNLLRQTDADNVGGIWDTRPWDGSIQARAVAAALTSRFGVGLSYRTYRGTEPIEVDTVPFGAWRASHFEKYGAFDGRFVRAQDLEHNIRVRRMGGRILCLPWLKIQYFARPTLGRLVRMAFDYGYWKVPVRAKHPVRFALRQYLPPAMVVGTAICLITSIRYPMALVPIGIYLAVVAGVALVGSAVRRSASIAFHFAIALILMHFGYGVGYISGLWDVFVRRRFQFSGELEDPVTSRAGTKEMGS